MGLVPYLCRETTRPQDNSPPDIGTFNDPTSFPGNGTSLLYGLGLDGDNCLIICLGDQLSETYCQWTSWSSAILVLDKKEPAIRGLYHDIEWKKTR